MRPALLLTYAYIADLVFGDPEWFPHPVRWMGAFIHLLDNRLRKNGPAWSERLKGVVAAVIVIMVSSCLAYLFIELAKRLNPLLGNAAWIYASYTTLSIKDLRVKPKAILNELDKGAIGEAREALSKIVSRNTLELDKDKIVISTIESIAENTCDGIVAPLFYLILGGPVLTIAYKSVNTLDSMIGYKNEKYLHFGWFSARMDDAANYIPARISGLLIALSSLILGKKALAASFQTMLRDGGKHPSPNSGISEAAMAGALGVRLGGAWSYDGKVSTKPFLGEEKRPVRAAMIDEALTLSLTSSLLMVFAGVIARWIF